MQVLPKGYGDATVEQGEGPCPHRAPVPGGESEQTQFLVMKSPMETVKQATRTVSMEVGLTDKLQLNLNFK